MKLELEPSAERGEESRFVNQASDHYTCDGPLSHCFRRLIMQACRPWIQGGSAIELGCADGVMTEMIAGAVEKLLVVDGSETFLARARVRAHGNVIYRYCLFEEFTAEEPVDYVFATYILEHVRDPVEVLKRAAGSLKPEGKLFIVVPNARALSRQLAQRMGLIQELKELTSNDLDHGHRRVYDRTDLNRDLNAAGLEAVSQQGILLKILADFQLNELIVRNVLREEHLQGLYQLGLEYPDLAGSLLAVCQPAL